MSLPKGLQAGPFTIEKQLSDKGGMADVYLAKDTERPKRKVVLKVSAPPGERGGAYQDLLRQETKILQELRHPSVVRLYPLRMGRQYSYVGRIPTIPYKPWFYAMEYLEGETLEEHLKTISKRFPIDWIMELFYQLLTAFKFVHASGYGHCDIKPQNIMFRTKPRADEPPSPVLIDFGTSMPKRAVNRVAATPRYAPPEVVIALKRPDIDIEQHKLQADKIDVWALGTLLFEMMTGEQLFPQKKIDQITTTILSGELKAIGTVRNDVDEDLDKFLRVMLRQSPNKRPTVDRLIHGLEDRLTFTRSPRITV